MTVHRDSGAQVRRRRRGIRAPVAGYKCIHCGAPAGKLWGRYWCPDCDSMRLAVLNKQFFEFQAALRGEQNDE